MVERNPGVVRSAVWDGRKRRDATPIGRDLVDLSPLCDVKVTRAPLLEAWSDSQVSFQTTALFTSGGRNRREKRDTARVIDEIDVLGAVFGHA